MGWNGYANEFYVQWIDRDAGLCGIYASQILPPEDAKSVKMSVLFEKTMYERLKEEEEKERHG